MKVALLLLLFTLLCCVQKRNTGVSALLQNTPTRTCATGDRTSNSQIFATTVSRPSSSSSFSSTDTDTDVPTRLEKLPFLVQQLKGQPSKSDCDAISSLVISVFFQEEAERLPEKRTGGSITKPLILAYLKNLQYGDVKGKKYMLGSGINNSMFVARRIIPLTDDAIAMENALGSGSSNGSGNGNGNGSSNGNGKDGWKGLSMEELMDEEIGGAVGSKIYNKDLLPFSEMGYITQDVLGFVDVTEKNFGLAGIGMEEEEILHDDDDDDDLTTNATTGESLPPRRRNSSKRRTLRPVLTNLSVKQEARCSGVGSALVDACENIVMDTWSRKYFEMVLEVEEENEAAQGFYEKREYVALFADPTSRRYDTSGLLLNNVRTTKICYRKDLALKRAQQGSNNNRGRGTNNAFNPGMFFAKIREAIGLD